MPDAIKIKLIKDEESKQNQVMQTSENPMEDAPVSLESPATMLGNVKVVAAVTALYKVVKELYDKQRSIEMQNRDNQEKLRNYGGGGFSANTIGDRFTIFGSRNGGESVAYKK